MTSFAGPYGANLNIIGLSSGSGSASIDSLRNSVVFIVFIKALRSMIWNEILIHCRQGFRKT